MGAPVTAILLAAGSSKRMGRAKPLLPLQGKTVIRRCIEAILDAGIDRCVVVVGAKNDAIRQEILDLPVTTVLNREEGSDMAHSVRVGFSEVDNRHTAVLVALSDHPLVNAETYRILSAAHSKEPRQILIPTYQEKRGHPTLFPVDLLGNFFHRCPSGPRPSSGLRALIRENSQRVKGVPVDDEGVVLDMDSEEDYQGIRNRTAASQ